MDQLEYSEQLNISITQDNAELQKNIAWSNHGLNCDPYHANCQIFYFGLALHQDLMSETSSYSSRFPLFS